MGWTLVCLSVVGWPLSMFTVAKAEPPVVLGLSWFAILLTAVDILMTADVRENEGDGG